MAATLGVGAWVLACAAFGVWWFLRPAPDEFDGARRRTHALDVMGTWDTCDPVAERRQALADADAAYHDAHPEVANDDR